ncbi:hypothetical protein VIGAN_02247200, partial [Vigna angularis var. angularis]
PPIKTHSSLHNFSILKTKPYLSTLCSFKKWLPMNHLGPTSGITGLIQSVGPTNLRRKATTTLSGRRRQWHRMASRS